MPFKVTANLFVLVLLVLLNPIFNVMGLQTDSVIIKPKTRVHLYEVDFNKNLSEASVKICFDGKAPEYLAVDYKKANKSIIEFPISKDGYIEYQGRFWKTENLKDNACIRYKSDISGYLAKNNKSEEKPPILSFQSNNLWLWLPDKTQINEIVHITFKLPSGFRLSTPWAIIDEEKHQFEIKDFSDDLGFTLMVGEFELRKIILNNGLHVNLAMLSNLKQKDNLQKWILNSLNSVVNYIGKIKLSHLQIILIENQQFKTGVVPWGDLRRGGGVGVRFVVSSEKDIKAFYLDWTATHEFSHLLMPNLEAEDLWLSEGLASYLQYFLMAQSGVISELETWQKLYDGFQRGITATNKGPSETLIDSVHRKNNRGDYTKIMRFYWTGAAYFFKTDWLLRKNSDGKVGLPDLLSQFNSCCMNNNNEWSGELLTEKFDLLSQTKIFSGLYKKIKQSKDFPAIESIFSELGIKVKDGLVLSLSPDKVLLRKNMLYQTSQYLSIND